MEWLFFRSASKKKLICSSIVVVDVAGYICQYMSMRGLLQWLPTYYLKIRQKIAATLIGPSDIYMVSMLRELK